MVQGSDDKPAKEDANATFRVLQKDRDAKSSDSHCLEEKLRRAVQIA